jgi:uncharacterized protein (DUF433 family)
MTSQLGDLRFDVHRYSVPQASEYLEVPYRTLTRWVNGYRNPANARQGPVVGQPIIHARDPQAGRERLSFAGLVEAQVIWALRKGGVSLQNLRRVTKALREELDEADDWGLVSKRLYVSGADVLWNLAEDWDDEEAAELVELASGQRVFTAAVRQYLERIEYDDEYARSLYLPVAGRRIVTVDPYRNFGDPTFTNGGAAVRMVLGRVDAGEPVEQVAGDYGVPLEDIEATRAYAASLAA